MYSSIIRKPCKCGCGRMPTPSFRGYNMECRPDIKAEIIKKQNARQYQKQKVGKLVREQMQDGNHDQASRQALMNDIDWVFSRIVRITAADKYGNCECYTCGSKKHWSLQQCGHFVPRANMATRWDFRNVRVQDKACNEGKHGNLEVFEANLNKEHFGLPDQLREMASEPHKWGISELKQLLSDLRAKLRLVESKFKT